MAGSPLETVAAQIVTEKRCSVAGKAKRATRLPEGIWVSNTLSERILASTKVYPLASQPYSNNCKRYD